MMGRITELEQKITLCAQEMETARKELLQIQREEKLTYIKKHLGEWFWNGDSYVKPLKVNENNILVLRVGRYNVNPYIEFEEIAWQNLSIEKSWETQLPEDVKAILGVILKTIETNHLKNIRIDF